MSKRVIGVKPAFIYDEWVMVKVYAPEAGPVGHRDSRPYYQRTRGYSGAMYAARERGLKVNKEA